MGKAKQHQVTFAGFPCIVEFSHYRAGDRTSSELVDRDDLELVATATVNIPEMPLEPNEVLIKNWSENEGILEVLREAGIIKATGKTALAAYAMANVCTLLVNPSAGGAL